VTWISGGSNINSFLITGTESAKNMVCGDSKAFQILSQPGVLTPGW
jgi:hypothetical protein